jgi:hypothetical protein
VDFRTISKPSITEILKQTRPSYPHRPDGFLLCAEKTLAKVFSAPIQLPVFCVSSEEFQSARAECDDTSHVEKIFQQKNTFAVMKYSPSPCEVDDIGYKIVEGVSFLETWEAEVRIEAPKKLLR